MWVFCRGFIINPGNEDFHSHSFISDGLNSFDEIAIFVNKIGIKKIVITDHCTAHMQQNGISRKFSPSYSVRWKNVHNDVTIEFGIEGDVIDDNGNICDDIWGRKLDFLILSAHPGVFQGKNITEAYIKAIETHHDKIKFIGHPCAKYFPELDIVALTETANKYNIPMEVNGSNIINGRTDFEKFKKMLTMAKRVYVNSDAHSFYEHVNARKIAFEKIKEFSP